MTFHDLRKWLDNNNNNIIQGSNNREKGETIKLLQQSQKFSIFKGLPFWINDIEKHKAEDARVGDSCCFNHTLGLPKKDGIEHKIYDYEQTLVNALDNHKSVFVKKARGLGITELLIRYMAWLAVKDSTYNNCRFHIVTGPRINLAEELIDRIHSLFMNSKSGEIDCKQVGPIIYVNNVTIQAFPSHTISSSRGYTDVKFILVDEADILSAINAAGRSLCSM